MKKTILIVDDSAFNISMLTKILGDSYLIMSAISGLTALEALKLQKPDLILLDIVMPGLDGFDVLRFMKKQNDLPNIPVIFVTSESGIDEEEKGLALGAVDYIKKPYNAAIVKARVRNQLELKSYRDDLEQLVKNRTEELAERTEQLIATREAIIMGMSLTSESHDKVTGEHIQRIKHFTKILSDKIMELYPEDLSPYYANNTVLFSPLHDIGKSGISDTILKKTGVLTPAEYEIMKLHTLKGAELLRKTESFLKRPGGSNDLDSLDVSIEIAECHHENYDGTGYPHGLKGEEIPLSARIVSIVDVYDALRSQRPYKKAFSHDEAINIILIGDGRTVPAHFDPKILNAFTLVHHEFTVYYDS